ncbi:MAG: hypothetical protein HY812_01110 [Planctomycetes bacterium]|nr:hypothetical protein [Planctomycetota bacterium]
MSTAKTGRTRCGRNARAAALALLLCACGEESREHEIAATRVVQDPGYDLDVTSAERFGFAEARGFDPAALRFQAPPSWSEVERPGMRLVTLAPRERPEAECWITVLPGDAGGVAANLNRWRGELGQEPLLPAEIEALPRVAVLGREEALLEVAGSYRGMDGREIADALLLGVVAQAPGHRLFIKMIGGREDVLAERDSFVAFCGSLEIAP